MNYNVIDNIAGTCKYVQMADYVMAFCGIDMYVIKSRSPLYTASPEVPCKPDMVVAYYSKPEPRIAELRLRKSVE